MSIEHRTLRVERDYPHPVSRVFAAWADPEVKRQWFTFSPDEGAEWRVDFRVGGSESYRSAPGATPQVAYDAAYCDIEDDERIIVTTVITVDGRRTSVSLSTAQFDSTADGSRLVVTEQVAFLDGAETTESRAGGTTSQLEALGALLDRHAGSV